MDRALQERVIGAIVLVAAAVLIVPVFLDGPSNDAETVSEVVSLPGQNHQQRTTQTVVLNLDRTEPVPTSTPSPAAVERQPDAARTQPPAAAKAAASAALRVDGKAPVSTQSSTGMWAVQLGSFSNQKNAERLAADLRKQGYAAFLSQLQTGSGALHRVRIGPQEDRDSAESVAARLARSGHVGQVVPHP